MLQFSLALGVFLLLYVVSIFVLPKIRFKDNSDTPGSITCYLKTNGSHVDIVMPIKTDYHDWTNILDQKDVIYADSSFQYVAFGWGDKNFYLNTSSWGDMTFSIAFKAAFWLSSGALHVTYYNQLETTNSCVPIQLNPNQIKNLYNFICSDFELDGNNKPIFIPTDKVYGNTDAFYNSNKTYSLFHTCNTWVNDALKSSDYKHCFWTALEFGVMDLVR